MGWKIEGSINPSIIKGHDGLPHSSAHNFYLGIFTTGITGLKMNWASKNELFRFPLGFYFRYMVGDPFDRAGVLNKVDSIAAVIQRKINFPSRRCSRGNS